MNQMKRKILIKNIVKKIPASTIVIAIDPAIEFRLK